MLSFICRNPPPAQFFTGPTGKTMSYPAGYKSFDAYRSVLAANLAKLQNQGPTRFSTASQHAALIQRYIKDIAEAKEVAS